MTFKKWHDDNLLTAKTFGSNIRFNQIYKDYDNLTMNKNTPRAAWDTW